MARGTPDVSVIIPTYNAGPQFEKVLGAISEQQTDFGYEVLVVDSGSSDRTLEVARGYAARVLNVPKSEFNHGGTRNRGISEARGEFLAMIVQDALPADELWLQGLVENLANDGTVAGVYSRQIPYPGSNPFTRFALENHYTNLPERREQGIDDLARYEALPPAQKLAQICFDDVSSCIRRSVWEEHPFERLSFGEDIEWAQRIMKAGYRIVYDPKSAVIHSHDRSAIYELKRAYVAHKLLGELIQFRTVPTFKDFRVRLRDLIRRNWKLAGASGDGLPLYARAVTRSIGEQTGVYLGGMAGSRTERDRVPRFVDRYLSSGV